MPNYRGRLIWPHVAVIGRIDTAATDAIDPPGPPTDGYDPIFSEPRAFGEEDARQVARAEIITRIPCQLEPDFLERVQALSNGQNMDGDAKIVLHFRNIEGQGLLDADNEPVFQKGDRLYEIRHEDTNALINRVPDPPGLYLVSWFYAYGLSGRDRNLMILGFNERRQGGGP